MSGLNQSHNQSILRSLEFPSTKSVRKLDKLQQGGPFTSQKNTLNILKPVLIEENKDEESILSANQKVSKKKIGKTSMAGRKKLNQKKNKKDQDEDDYLTPQDFI